MRGVIFILLLMSAMSSWAVLHIEMTVNPKYQDNLNGFINLHKTLTRQEKNMVISVGAAKVEMTGMRDKGSSYSSHEQLLEKKLKDNSHYLILGVELAATIAEVAICANEYVDFTQYMSQRIKVMPDAVLIWTRTSDFITKEIEHAKKLMASLEAKALLGSRSTSAEKAKLIWTLKETVDKMRASIRRGRTLGGLYLNQRFEQLSVDDGFKKDF